MNNGDEKNNNKKNITEDAQAEERSELLPIYDAVNRDGDFQPLEDIEEPEFIEPDFLYDGGENEKHVNERTKSRKKHLKLTSGFINKKRIITCVAVVVLVAAAAVAAKIFTEKRNNTAGVEIVYTADDRSSVLRLDDGKEYPLGKVCDVKVTDDGRIVYYTVETKAKTGAYDLFCLRFDKGNTLQGREKTVATGISGGWTISSDGSYCAYCVTRPGASNFYLYSLAYGKAEEIAEEIEDVFLPQTGSVIYFTRRNGPIYSLHRKNYGEKSHSVASRLEKVKVYSDRDGFEILYTQKTGYGESFNIWTVSGIDEPALICSNVDEAYLDEYTVNGNLYYFQKSTARTDWRDFVADDYYDEDLKIQKPDKNDYVHEKGFIFKRMVLDTNAFERDTEKYNAKAARDRVREALDIFDPDSAETEEYICSFYNKTVSKKLASGVGLDGILAVSPTGSPKILYRKTVRPVKDKLDINELSKMAEKDGLAATMDFVRKKIASDSKDSVKNVLCIYDNSTVKQINIDGYDTAHTEYLPATKTELYTVEGGLLYCNNISGGTIAPGEMVSENVSGYEVSGKYIYFLSGKEGEPQTLYRFNPEDGKKEIAKEVGFYFLRDDGKAVVFSGDVTQSDTLTVSVFDGEKTVTVDEDVLSSDFILSEDKLAYKKNTASSDTPGNGEGYIYSFSGEREKFADNVKSIKYVN